ncbi:hypothetical protein AAY473_002514 [Plecturocebus cupreus]
MVFTVNFNTHHQIGIHSEMMVPCISGSEPGYTYRSPRELWKNKDLRLRQENRLNVGGRGCSERR